MHCTAASVPDEVPENAALHRLKLYNLWSKCHASKNNYYILYIIGGGVKITSSLKSMAERNLETSLSQQSNSGQDFDRVRPTYSMYARDTLSLQRPQTLQ